MRRMLASLILTLLTSSLTLADTAAMHSELEFYVVGTEASLDHMPSQYEVRVLEDEREYIVELDDKVKWYQDAFHKSVFATVDLDADTVPEAIIETGHSGNCCGPTFYIIKRISSGFYTIIESEYLTGWPSVEIIEGPSGNRLRVKNFSEGADNTSQEETLTELELIAGRLIVALHYKNNSSRVAVHDITSEELRIAKEHLITFDMDLDGIEDELACNYWSRWGAVSCELSASKIGTVRITGACNRIGILEEVNQGVHSLVCNRGKVIKWGHESRSFE